MNLVGKSFRNTHLKITFKKIPPLLFFLKRSVNRRWESSLGGYLQRNFLCFGFNLTKTNNITYGRKVIDSQYKYQNQEFCCKFLIIGYWDLGVTPEGYS